MCIPKRRQPSARGLARSSSSRTATASKSTIHPARFWPARSEMGDAEHGRLKRKEYEKELAKLHVELVKLQEWVKQQRAKICIVFEGRDGAGKGGTIKALTERVSPRVFRVVALPAPTDREKSQMYAQRYLVHLPAAGEVVIFDRSWYNRAGVERVMGYCTDEEAQRFLEAPRAWSTRWSSRASFSSSTGSR